MGLVCKVEIASIAKSKIVPTSTACVLTEPLQRHDVFCQAKHSKDSSAQTDTGMHTEMQVIYDVVEIEGFLSRYANEVRG